MNFTKLASMATVISLISGISFATITAFNSEDGNIKAAITKLRNAALNYKDKYEQAQKNYEDTLKDLGDTQQSLEAAKQKLMNIYKALTGQDWNTEEDILAFDFDTIIPENNFDNNVDGDAIAAQLGLDKGATTQEILTAIIDLQEQVASLSQQVANLTSQVEAYANEAAELKTQLEAEQTRLEQERTALDNLMKQINKEEQEQLNAANEALEAVGEKPVTDLSRAEDEARTAIQNSMFKSYEDELFDGTYTIRSSSEYVLMNADGTEAGKSMGKNDGTNAAYQAWYAWYNMSQAQQ